jgi:hypothetical protein
MSNIIVGSINEIICETENDKPKTPLPNGTLVYVNDTKTHYIYDLSIKNYVLAGHAKAGNVKTDKAGMATITFTTPYSNNNYSASFTTINNPGVFIECLEKEKNFIKIKTVDRIGRKVGNISVDWICSRYNNI